MHRFERCQSTKRCSRVLREEPPRAWNSIGHKNEEYATTKEMDFMGCVTMSPASGRQTHLTNSWTLHCPQIRKVKEDWYLSQCFPDQNHKIYTKANWQKCNTFEHFMENTIGYYTMSWVFIPACIACFLHRFLWERHMNSQINKLINHIT